MLFILVLLLLASIQCFGQAWSGIVDPSRAIDWQNVGAPHINDNRPQCGATIAAGASAASIQAALRGTGTGYTSCNSTNYPNGFVILLGAGEFDPTASIEVPSNATLRGSGSRSDTGTRLIPSTSSSPCTNFVLCSDSSDSNWVTSPSNTANWTAGYSQGSTTISLSNVSNLKVGSPIILDQVDDQQDTGGFYNGCEYGADKVSPAANDGTYDPSPACTGFAHPNTMERGLGSLTTISGQQQIVNVASCTTSSGAGDTTFGHSCTSGTNITISPGIYAPNWRSSQSPGAWWSSSPAFNAGIENMYVLIPLSAQGVEFFNCTGCWIKGLALVASTAVTDMTSPWHALSLTLSNHCTVRDSYHFGGGNVDTYGFGVTMGSDDLFENNIGQYPGEGIINNSDCEGCVASFNFAVGTYYGSSSNWIEGSDVFHGVQLYQLFEGNIGEGIYADASHGTHANNTFFRNRWDGRELNGVNQTSSNTSVIWSTGARYNNIIANVFGTPGYHTNYKAVSGASSNTVSSSTITLGAYPEEPTNDPYVTVSSFLWGNWNSVSNAVLWCGNSSDTGWATICNGRSAAITALSEGSGPTGPPTTGTVSVTSTLNPGVGSVVTITAASPSGYNGNFFVTASNSTSFQYTDSMTGLGSGSTGTATVGSEVPTSLQNLASYSGYSNPSITFSNSVPTLGDRGAAQGALPASFVYASKPSWWPSTKPWPSIGPDVTGGNVGQCSGGIYNSAEVISSSACIGGSMTPVAGGLVISNPAMDCYYNIMGGSPDGTESAYVFDVSACYGATQGSITLQGNLTVSGNVVAK